MTDYREINALQRDPERANQLAQILLKLQGVDWNDWELDFLHNMAAQTEDLTTRQAEKLIELRDNSMWFETVEGFLLRRLVEVCYLNRLDLGEADEHFIVEKWKCGATRFRRSNASRILRCARVIGQLEPYQGHSLDREQFEEAA